jgi:outer membrane immunogenic protein
MGTATSTVGIAHDRGLIYGKAGVAWAKTDFTDNWTLNVAGGIPLFAGTGSTSGSNQVGWTVGTGIEWAIWNNWSIKAEYALDLATRPWPSMAASGPRQYPGVVRYQNTQHQSGQGRPELAHRSNIW